MADLSSEDSVLDNRWRHMFDTVIMNPPFGTKKNKGEQWITLNREKTYVSSRIASIRTIDQTEKRICL